MSWTRRNPHSPDALMVRVIDELSEDALVELLHSLELIRRDADELARRVKDELRTRNEETKEAMTE
jgi:hypothetical protein